MKGVLKKVISVCCIFFLIAAAVFCSPVNSKADNKPNDTYYKTVTIALAGDCSIGKLSVHGYSGSVDQYYDTYGPSYFFSQVKPYFDLADMTLVNFEGVLTDSNKLVEKQYNIKGRPEFISVIPAGGIDAVSFGNNHRIDYGQQGVDDTVAAFNSINLPYAYDDITATYTTQNGIKIGYVSVNVVYDGRKVEKYITQGINSLRAAGCDLVLCCNHWGDEVTYYPNKYQTELGHKCIDWGADLVVGSHPHVIQGIEYYNGKYIIYSLGNFCFGGHMNPKDKDSMIVLATFKIVGKTPVGDATLQIVPCRISSRDDKNDYCPTPATGEKYTKIIGRLNTYSKKLNVVVSDMGAVSHL